MEIVVRAYKKCLKRTYNYRTNTELEEGVLKQKNFARVLERLAQKIIENGKK